MYADSRKFLCMNVQLLSLKKTRRVLNPTARKIRDGRQHYTADTEIRVVKVLCSPA